MPATRYFLKEPNKSGKVRIMLMISHGCKEKKYATGISVLKKELQANKIRIKSQYSSAGQINNRLDEIDDKVWEIFRTFQFKNEPFTLDQVLEEFEPWYRPNKKLVNKSSFDDAFKAWIEYCEGPIDPKNPRSRPRNSPKTVSQKEVLKSNIEEANIPGVMFSEAWMDDFLNWMFDVKAYDPKGTMKKKIVRIREFVKFCNKKGFNFSQDALRWEPKREFQNFPKTKNFVTPAEYLKIRDAKLTGEPYLQKIRDIAVVLYNIGQHYADSDLDVSDIYQGMVDKFRAKNKQRFIVPVTPDLQAVLDRHNGHPPHLSNQKTNDGLKALFDHLGLNRVVRVETNPAGIPHIEQKRLSQVISVKIMGRYSAGTNLATAGIHDKHISTIFGHTDVKQQNDYIGTSDETIEKIKKALQGKK